MATGVLAIGLVVTGAGLIESRATSLPPVEAAPLVAIDPMTVRITDGYEVTRSFVGQVEPLQQTEVAFELAGIVDTVNVDEGEHVAEGQILASLDTRTLENQKATLLAARKALEAQAELARLTTERRERLEDRGFSTTQAFDEARLGLAELEARLAETDMSIAGIDIQLDKSVLRAPFGGRVGARSADEGAWVANGAPIVSLLQNARPHMRVGIAPSIADTLRPGDRFTVSVAGKVYEAELLRLRPDLDATTRTRTALLQIEAQADQSAPLYGQTGSLDLAQDVAEEGAWVPMTALREGARGVWTVLTLEPADAADEALVSFEAVEIIYADQDRAFVRGTFEDGVRIVSAGQHRVTPGQRIRLDTQG
ncbi:efflux RND transporter periplasmic adaptor subunit [Bauldia sp.]|uniref:efflux RND transporter periplasmic adaptor subunit n=1 Tax=Bauldia sp. TaxID=2575872 RepID=UPI003BAD5E7D